ncbi:MAG: metal-sensitive transcriptional regulator [Candidatus Gracilibacteria bacterium]|nr:metal-sensitive transcriptional regulator [Candidatus Peregrinibacteria bacterium]
MSQKLIHRLNRIQGQIDAIKRLTESEDFSQETCIQNLQLLKASINGLKKFGAAYVAENMKKCIKDKKSPAEQEKLMLTFIDTGFDL